MTYFSELGSKCADCPFKPSEGGLPRCPEVPANVDVVALAEGPSSYRSLWKKALPVAGVPAERIATCTLVQCRPPDGTATKKNFEEARDACSTGATAYLQQVLSANPLAYVFAQGGHALKVTTGHGNLKKWLGGPLPSLVHTGTVIGSYDPATLRGPKDKAKQPTWLRHLNWVHKLAIGEMKPWKWPRIVTTWTPEAKRYLKEMLHAPRIAIDIETSGIDEDSTIRCIGLATKDVAVCLPYDPSAEWYPYIRAVVEAENVAKVWQNGGFDRKYLRKWGMKPAGENHDLMLLHAIKYPQEYHGLGVVAGSHTWAENWKAQHNADKDEY